MAIFSLACQLFIVSLRVQTYQSDLLYTLQTSQEVPWVVTSSDKSRYDTMFKQADKDADGLVSGKRKCYIAQFFAKQHALSLVTLRSHGI